MVGVLITANISLVPLPHGEVGHKLSMCVSHFFLQEVVVISLTWKQHIRMKPHTRESDNSRYVIRELTQMIRVGTSIGGGVVFRSLVPAWVKTQRM